MITKTRAQFRALVARRARVVDHFNSHPVADQNTDLDECYRKTRQLLTTNGWGDFLKTTGVLTLPLTPPVATEKFVVIPVPTDVEQIRRLELLTNGRDWVAAEEVPFEQFRGLQFSYSGGATSNYGPFQWTTLDQGLQATVEANTGSAVAGRIALSPLPVSGSYQLWYLPQFSGLTADSGAGGFYAYPNQAAHDYHFWCACELFAISDNDREGLQKVFAEKKLESAALLLSSSPRNTNPRQQRRTVNFWPRGRGFS